MSKKLNLNSDLGESFGAWDMGSDDAMLRIVNSANVACGYHAGDPLVMCKTTKLAKECGVSIGAHPGYPDLQGFGRRRMDIPLAELEAMLIYQIGALDACARSQGGRVTHVKPHGALSNIACADRKVADAVARAVAKRPRRRERRAGRCGRARRAVNPCRTRPRRGSKRWRPSADGPL